MRGTLTGKSAGEPYSSGPVELVSGRGEDFWPRPGRVLLAARGMTFDALAEAVDTAFGRWDRAHLHTLASPTGRC